ncbi:MAG: patatin-like phospholipase family protein [Rhodomicrobium sp.]
MTEATSTEGDIRSWFLSLLGVRQVFRSKYDAAALEEHFLRHFGNHTIKESLTNIMISAFDLINREPIFITNMSEMLPGIGSYFHDYTFAEAARATSAAPVYLDPAEVKVGNLGTQLLIDGGIFANDPTLYAYLQALRMGFREDQIYVLSLGTGRHFIRQIYEKEAATWGLKDWLDPSKDVPLFSVLLDAPSKVTSRMMYKCFPNNYCRIDGELHDSIQMDQATSSDIARIQHAALNIIGSHDNQDKIQKFADIIIKEATAAAPVPDQVPSAA